MSRETIPLIHWFVLFAPRRVVSEAQRKCQRKNGLKKQNKFGNELREPFFQLFFCELSSENMERDLAPEEVKRPTRAALFFVILSSVNGDEKLHNSAY